MDTCVGSQAAETCSLAKFVFVDEYKVARFKRSNSDKICAFGQQGNTCGMKRRTCRGNEACMRVHTEAWVTIMYSSPNFITSLKVPIVSQLFEGDTG